jgi:hypothetical protein
MKRVYAIERKAGNGMVKSVQGQLLMLLHRRDKSWQHQPIPKNWLVHLCNEKRSLQLPVKTKVQAKFTLAIGMNCRIVSRSQRNPLSAIPLVMLRSWENTDLATCIN